MRTNDNTPRGDRTEIPDDTGPKDRYDEHVSPYEWAAWGGWGLEWPYRFGRGDDDAEVGDESGDARAGRGDDRDESRVDEGLVTLFLVVGVILFVFPEPGTSVVGLFLVLVGTVGWIVDAAR
ncbi:hypothetical protein [Halorussus sp. MSC15.2]|uniref:hypothetical protein n=1 Tax=Halorussus sp. MSC15.2 TaxID=2283638 RepID=UPI0013D5997E|nr:hypothetical protein [Halorussus sp. MSC15.2]NEU58637.1 hypothetical protein [Halorussus sp. MSC15.2]